MSAEQWRAADHPQPQQQRTSAPPTPPSSSPFTTPPPPSPLTLHHTPSTSYSGASSPPARKRLCEESGVLSPSHRCVRCPLPPPLCPSGGPLPPVGDVCASSSGLCVPMSAASISLLLSPICVLSLASLSPQLSVCAHTPLLLLTAVVLLLLSMSHSDATEHSPVRQQSQQEECTPSSPPTCCTASLDTAAPVHRRHRLDHPHRHTRQHRSHPYHHSRASSSSSFSPMSSLSAVADGSELRPTSSLAASAHPSASPCHSTTPIDVALATSTSSTSSTSPSSTSSLSSPRLPSSTPLRSCSSSGSPSFPSPESLLQSLHSNCSTSYPALACSPYRLQRTLQPTLFGTVKLGYHSSTGAQVCVKISLLSSSHAGLTVHGGKAVSEDVKREAELLRELRGVEGVVELLDELEDDTWHYLVEGYCGDDLFVLLKSLPLQPQPHLDDVSHRHTAAVACLPEARARPLFQQLVRVVQGCHARHVALQDLSLENVCIDQQGRVRIIDLGLAKKHPQADQLPTSPTTAAAAPSSLEELIVPASSPSLPLSGKLQYLSPESYAHEEFDAFAHDRYALGVLLYTLLVGRPPYFEPTHCDYWCCASHTTHRSCTLAHLLSPTSHDPRVFSLLPRCYVMSG